MEAGTFRGYLIKTDLLQEDLMPIIIDLAILSPLRDKKERKRDERKKIHIANFEVEKEKQTC